MRIAPVERWCPHQVIGISEEVLAKAAGIEVAILTETMSKDEKCGGRTWMQYREDVNVARERVGLEPTVDDDYRWFCEHMLAMD